MMVYLFAAGLAGSVSMNVVLYRKVWAANDRTIEAENKIGELERENRRRDWLHRPRGLPEWAKVPKAEPFAALPAAKVATGAAPTAEHQLVDLEFPSPIAIDVDAWTAEHPLPVPHWRPDVETRQHPRLRDRLPHMPGVVSYYG